MKNANKRNCSTQLSRHKGYYRNSFQTYGRVWLKKCTYLTLAATLYLSYEDMTGPARTVTES